jgi:ammonium transporter Rh
MDTLINSDFASAAVLISFGAVLGKVSALQLLIMAMIEVVIYEVNEYIVLDRLHVTDVGDSMVVHAFGAYFGLAVAAIQAIHNRHELEKAEDKEGSIYHSDLFSMIGTIFLWLFWPSFNAGTAVDEGQVRAIVNTYYSLTASCIVAFAISSFVTKDKFNMVHIQNSTLAGGVAIGTLADMIIQPWAAILVGGVAGVISVLGFRYLTPFLSKRLHIHDTCGVNNLHGMPGIISGLGAILAAGLATDELYKDGLHKIFTEDRTVGQQAGYQAAGLAISLAMGLGGGIFTGLILLIPIWDEPTSDRIFDDAETWLMPPLVDERVTDGCAYNNNKAAAPRPSDVGLPVVASTSEFIHSAKL